MGLWLANLSNFILCFTYFKAVINTLLVKMGFKKASGFKVGGVVAVCSCAAVLTAQLNCCCWLWSSACTCLHIMKAPCGI
jgi:hypothetical protein